MAELWMSTSRKTDAYHQVAPGGLVTECGRRVGGIVDGRSMQGRLLDQTAAAVEGKRGCTRCFDRQAFNARHQPDVAPSKDHRGAVR